VSRHVVVVGGGVIGLATAYYLRRDGAEVTLLERSRIGAGASWGNSGWVDPTFSAPLAGPGMVAAALGALARRTGAFYLSPKHLPGLAPWLWRFWRASSADRHDAGMHATGRLALPAQDLYDDLAADGVRFETKRLGIVHAFLDGQRAERVRRGFVPLTELGFHLPEGIVDGDQLREAEPALSREVVAGFIVPNERVVYPPSLLAGLRNRIAELGGKVVEHTPVSHFDTKNGVVTAVEGVEADAVVLAAGVWTRQLAAQLGIRLPLEAGKGYSFSVEPKTMPSHCLHLYEAKVAVSPFTGRIRVAGTMELSGLDERLDERRLAAVARSAAHYLTGWRDGSREEDWMGMRPMTADGLPVLGRPAAWRNVYLATGHGMVGVMLAPASGRAIARLALENAELPELGPFNPDRFLRQGHHGQTRPTEVPVSTATTTGKS
jgi:D-amino-acid dehydrogenase